MNKLLITLSIIVALMLPSACSMKPNSQETLGIVQATIRVPGSIALNAESVLSVQLTQGAKKVDDADDVEFEIWKADQKEKSIIMKASHGKDGIYSIKTSFQEGGLYHVQTHVMARGLHVMPEKSFIVGIATKEELDSLLEEPQSQSQSQVQSQEHHH